jgi:hypothetical protein
MIAREVMRSVFEFKQTLGFAFVSRVKAFALVCLIVLNPPDFST